jgi:glycosyltransferase involved in cell wall biosynthesis
MISVIIPTYQSPEYLDLCLHSIFKTQTYDNQIIVVVDGFLDLNKAVLDKYPKVQILDLGSNQGLSVGTNWGVYNSQFEDILIVNDDNVFCNNWDINLIDKAQDGFVWAVNQIEPNPSMFPQFDIKDLGKTPNEFNLDKFLDYADSKNIDNVEMNGSTLPIFMKHKDYLSVGGWDVMYPSPHVVDWDFFLKCSKHFQMWRTYNTHFYHFAGASTRKTPEQDIESTNKERSAHEFARLKWGSYIFHNPQNNLKYVE